MPRPADMLAERGNFYWYIDNQAEAARIVEYICDNYRRARLPEYFSREPYVWVDDQSIAAAIG
jgi:hypothetical protein